MDTLHEQTLIFSFSHEELVVLLGVLKLNSLPGMNPNLAAPYQTEETRAALLAAQHSLQARGVLLISTEQVTVDQVIAGIILGCATARALFIRIDTPTQGLATRTLCYISEGFVVEIATQVPGVHRFRLLPSLTATAEVLIAGLDVQPASSTPPMRIPLTWVSRWREGGLEALRADGLPDEAAAFDALLRTVTATHTFIGLDTRPPGTPGQSFGILSAADGLVLLTADGQLTPIEGATVADQVVGLFSMTLPDLFAEPA